MIYKFEKRSPEPMYENHLHLGGKNQNGDEINLNSKYLTRNGKPYMPVMAEIHYSRIKHENWEQELLKMKAGGITLISTYVFWIYHEETEGEYNFTGDNDVHAFVELCKKHGLDVVLRIGPWAHGECRNGGFPDWLLEKPFKLRDNNDDYIALVKKWYTAIYNEVKDLLFPVNGNIIAIQLENELTDRADHLLKLKELAKEVGLEAPIYTVTGWNSIYGAEIPKYDVMPVFGGYPEAPWEDHRNKLHPSPHYFFHHMRNDSAIGTDLISKSDGNHEGIQYELYPFATCELGGGIQITHHRRPVINWRDIYAISLVKTGCGNNLTGYYMYHGGTNQIGKKSTLNESKATGYPNDYPILSYDFQAAIGEYGLIREQYRRLKDLHLFINDFMEYLAPMEAYVQETPIVDRTDTESLRYGMREKDGSGFVFVNNYQRLEDLKNHTDVQFDTGSVIFPKISIKDKISFILPFNMKINGANLDWATAQLLCHDGDTYFFKKIDGIEPLYSVDGKVYTGKSIDTGSFKIVTIDSMELYKIDGVVYMTNADLYVNNGQVVVYGFDKYAEYYIWKNGEFEKHTVSREPLATNISYKETDVDAALPYLYELQIGSERKMRAYEITTDAEDGFVEISYTADAIQLYINNELKADDYFYNGIWKFPVSLLENGKGIIVISELKDDAYFEVEISEGCEIKDIKISCC